MWKSSLFLSLMMSICHLQGTSISETSSYPAFCQSAADNDTIFSSFKRDPSYQQILEHVDYNQGSYLDTTTGIFTAPVAGLYSVHLVARVSNTSSAQIAIVKNYASTNTIQAMWEAGANCTTNHFGVSSIAKLAVGDTLVIKVFLGQINFDGNDNWAIAFLG